MRLRTLRITSQVFFSLIAWLGLAGVAMTGLIYPYFFCPASPGAWAGCPIKFLELGFMGVESSGLFLVYLLGFYGILTLLIGRGFCGWMCPIGFLQEVLYKIRRAVMPVLRLLKGPANRIAGAIEGISPDPKYYKYGILVLIPLTSLATGSLIFTDIDPIGGITATIPTLLMGGSFEPGKYFWFKMALVFMFLVISFVFMRAWCRFLCPLGALASPMNKFSFLKVELDGKKCTKCSACVKACPMSIDTLDMDRDMECILCGRCVSACELHAMKMSFLEKELFKDS